jgi:hypothetical protein
MRVIIFFIGSLLYATSSLLPPYAVDSSPFAPFIFFNPNAGSAGHAGAVARHK